MMDVEPGSGQKTNPSSGRRRKDLWKQVIAAPLATPVPVATAVVAPTVVVQSIATPESTPIMHANLEIFFGDKSDDDDNGVLPLSPLGQDTVSIKCRTALIPPARPSPVVSVAVVPEPPFSPVQDDPQAPVMGDAPVDHILLLVHGINSSERNLEKNLEKFKEAIDHVQMVWSFGGTSPASHVVSRRNPQNPTVPSAATLVHCDLINWKSAVIGIQSSLFERITPREMSYESRMFINLSISDVAFYMTPSHCELIQSTVIQMLNDRVFELRKNYPKKFRNSKISLVGYSLGSVILHDILSEKITRLNFPVSNLFIWGSPLAAYLSVKDREFQSGKFTLPNKVNLFNIYHPHDPVAFRIEPLFYHLDSELADSELVPYWENNGLLTGKAFQKSIYDFKRNVSNQWGDFVAAISGSGLGNGGRNSAMLIPKRRLDFVLQESVTENLSHNVSMLTAHYSYWSSRDVALFVLKHLTDPSPPVGHAGNN